MEKIARIGMDTSKNVFQLHGVNEDEEPVLRRKLRRTQMIMFMSRLSPTVVGIEAGGAAHYWARTFKSGSSLRNSSSRMSSAARMTLQMPRLCARP